MVCACLLLQLYTQEFYETVVKQKLNPGGIFVTQSGPAGVMSASQVRC
jgi:thermospermine synthase